MPESGVVPLMNAETEVAIVFADVVGSTRLYELLGDHQARDMILICVELMRGSTERNRGTVIKTIGDEILAIFPTANDAVNAAAEMQHDIGGHPALTVQGSTSRSGSVATSAQSSSKTRTSSARRCTPPTA